MNDIAAAETTNERLGKLAPELAERGEQVTWLDDRWSELVEALPAIGPVRVTTQNRVATHIKFGPFDDITFNGPVGLVLGEPIDQRLFSHHWTWAFATTGKSSGVRIFDVHGREMMRIDLVADSDREAFDEFVESFRTEAPDVTLDPNIETPDLDAEVPEDVIDAFRADWRAMEDTHEFFGLLREHELDRAVSMRVGPPEMVTRLGGPVCEDLFTQLTSIDLPVMIFVRSAGCVQIHTGPVELTGRVGDELRVTGKDFEMSARTDQIGEYWAVRKPTEDGNVTSIEFYDADADLAFQVFGERKPGVPELEEWLELVDDVERRFGR
jgi:putative hemin transport protein